MLALNHARDHGTAASPAQITLLQSAIFDTVDIARATEAWQAKKPAAVDALAPVAPR